MKTVELTEASAHLAEYARSVEEEPLILTSESKPIAALVSLSNVDEESLALSTNPEFLRVIQAAREEVRRGEVGSLEEMKREFAGE